MSAAESVASSFPLITWIVDVDLEMPSIETTRLKLRPVEKQDISNYVKLFANPKATQKYLGGPRAPDITTTRVDQWAARWQQHHFSAFAVFLKSEDDSESSFVGHVVLGHGDYEDNVENGWSEVAIMIDPKFWNRREVTQLNEGAASSASVEPKVDENSPQYERIGSEISEAIAMYALELFNRKELVPVDVTIGQRQEVERLFMKGSIQRVLKEGGNITAAMLPFKGVRFTTQKDNEAIIKIATALAEKFSCEKRDKSDDSSRLQWAFKA